MCSKCPQLKVCSLLHQKDVNSQTTIDTYDNSISYLNDAHKSFFYRWYDMLEFEFGVGEYRQFEAGELIWWKSKRDMEATGFAVFDLKLDNTKTNQINNDTKDGDFAMDRFFSFDFFKTRGY